MYNCEISSLEIEEKIIVLEIENPKIFNGILKDIFMAEFPYNEIAIDDGKGLLKAKDFLCIIDFYNFNLTEKTLTTKLYKYLDKYISENTFLRLKYDEIFSNFATSLTALLDDIDIDFEYSQTNEIKNALSLINMILYVDNDSLIEKLLQYIKICSELNLCKIIFLVNVKAFLIKDELLLLYKQSLYYKIPIILLESQHSEDLLENEEKVFTDRNFCDILIM